MFEDEKEIIATLFMDQRLVRNKLELVAAQTYLEKIRKILDNVPDKELYLERSRYGYEKAYILLLSGDYDASATAFRETAHFSQTEDDELRWWIGEYQYWLISYYGGLVSASDACDNFAHLETLYHKMQNIRDADKVLYEGFEFNLNMTLANFGFECGHPKYTVWSDRARGKDYLGSNKEKGEPTFVLFDHRMDAREMMNDGAYMAASEKFLSFLDASILEFLPSMSVERNEVLASADFENYEVMARDYRDLIRSLSHSKPEGWEAAAERAASISLALRVGSCNKIFQDDIRSDLLELKLDDPT